MQHDEMKQFIKDNLTIELGLDEAGYCDYYHKFVVKLKLEGEVISEDEKYLTEITSNMQSYFKREDSSY